MSTTADPTDHATGTGTSTEASAARRPSENVYLSGNYAPVERELTAFDLPVTGTIPADLEGRWLRNGPNPSPTVDGSTHHWFLGRGMVHGIRLRGGRAEWYRNRYVDGNGARDDDNGGDGDEFSPNTNVGGFAGTTWAMVEAGPPPVELGYELDSRGVNPFGGTLPNGFSAHPKYDPATGELHAVCYQYPDLADHVQYVVVGGDGRVARVVDVPVPDMPMIHDMSLTDTYAVVYDLPVTVNIENVLAGASWPFTWAPDRAARVGLLPRTGTGDDVIWCDVDPCYVFHPLNAYDEDGTVVVDVCRYDRMMDEDFRGPFTDAPPTFDRWVIDPVGKRVHESRWDDRPQEFPRHNPTVGLRRHRYGYTSEVFEGDVPNLHGATIKHDVERGTSEAHEYGPGRGGAEPIVVPKADAVDEDDCWVLTVVYDAITDGSELCILDAKDITGPEVARIELPQRVPFGFHGNWVADASVAPDA